MLCKSGLDITIRTETPEDYPEVYNVVHTAFSAINDFEVADYLNNVRKKDTFIPGLSFVATLQNHKIIGQITLYKTNITTTKGLVTQLVLSPISVLPEYQNMGIAGLMIEYACEQAKQMGYKAVFLQGDPNFYSKFHFVPTYLYEIYHEDDKDRNAEYCMVRLLEENALFGITGTTNYL